MKRKKPRKSSPKKSASEPPRLSHLRARMIEDMNLAGLALQTQQAYQPVEKGGDLRCQADLVCSDIQIPKIDLPPEKCR